MPPGPNARPAPVAIEIGEPLFSEAVALARPAAVPVKPEGKARRRRSRWLAWLLTGAIVLLGAIGWTAVHHGAHDSGRTAHARAR